MAIGSRASTFRDQRQSFEYLFNSVAHAVAAAASGPAGSTFDAKIKATIVRGDVNEMRALLRTLEGSGDLSPVARVALERAIIQGEVRFGTNANQVSHAFRHIKGAGFSRVEVEAAIRADLTVSRATAQLQVGETMNMSTVVRGTRLDYVIHRVSDTFVNIGRITTP